MNDNNEKFAAPIMSAEDTKKLMPKEFTTDANISTEEKMPETSEEFDAMIKEISESANEDIKHFREIESSPDKKEEDITEVTGGEDIKDSSLSIEEAIDSDKLNEENENIIRNSLKSNPSLDLSDEEISSMMEIIMKFRAGEKFSYYKSMPEKMKIMVRELAVEAGVGASQYNSLAEFVLKEFVSSSELDQAFLNFDKAVNQALNMPDISDMYSEGIRETMEVKLPDLAKKIRDESPEKADSLLKIRDAFINGYHYEKLSNNFKKSRVRKAAKRFKDWSTYCDEFNYMNRNSRFKMMDSHMMFDGLMTCFNNFPNGKSEEDYPYSSIWNSDTLSMIFIAVWCRSCENLNPDDLIDAAYMYYGMKNIVMLKFIEEAKTDFSKEIVKNVWDLVEKVLEEKSQFYKSGSVL